MVSEVEIPLWKRAMAVVDPAGLDELAPGEMPPPERLVEIAVEYGKRQRGRAKLPQCERLKVASIRIDETTWTALEILAQRAGLSRTNLARNVLRGHVEDAVELGDLDPDEVERVLSSS